jgi:hypothetical protein
MTRFDDLDRALTAWFEAEAVAPAPAGLLPAVVASTAARRPRAEWIARMRQFHIPWPGLDVAPVPVSAWLLLLLLLVASTVAAGAALWLERSERTLVMVPASPRPSAALPVATTTPEPGSVPPVLRYAWVGTPRVLPGYGIETRTKLNFDANRFWGTGTNYPPQVAYSSVTLEGSSLVLTGASGDCASSQTGRYPWSLSTDGTVLEVLPGSDTCAARAALMPGTWYRTDCKDTTDQCLGVLEAGRYPSQYIDPRVKNGDWHPRLGAITFTVPDGWANSGDFPSRFILTPAADYANESPQGPPTGTAHDIVVFTQPAAAVQDGTCEANDDRAIGPTVDALVAWLRTRPGLQTGAPVPIMIDGHPGQMLDLSLSPSWSTACPGNASPSAVFLTEAGFHLDSYAIGFAAGEQARLLLLDLGQADVVGILIRSTQPDRFDGLIQAAMPIVESLRFK